MAHANCIGRVVGIEDGEPVKVRKQGVEAKLRLTGIDAPEKRQAFGPASKPVLFDRIVGQTV